MKKLLFILLITPLFSLAQSGEPVSDTSYFVKQGDQFFEVKMFAYQDGSEQTYKTLIGDSATFVQSAKDRLVSSAATMAVDVRHVSTFTRKIKELLRESDQVKTLTGQDPQRLVQDDYDDAFLSGDWTIKRDGTISSVTFSLNAQGALRYSVNAGATKSALLIGNTMRLKNYPANGTDTDMYVLPNGVWVSSDRSAVMRPPGNDNPVNRAPAPSPARTKKGN